MEARIKIPEEQFKEAFRAVQSGQNVGVTATKFEFDYHQFYWAVKRFQEFGDECFEIKVRRGAKKGTKRGQRSEPDPEYIAEEFKEKAESWNTALYQIVPNSLRSK